MTHICNKCQQWRPVWLWAPLNDSWKCSLMWLWRTLKSFSGILSSRWPALWGRAVNNRSNNGYLTPHRVAGKNPNACASSQLDWWHHRDQSPELGSKSTEWGLPITSCTYCTAWEGTNIQSKRHTSHTTTRRLFMSRGRKGDRGKQICHQQEAGSE